MKCHALYVLLLVTFISHRAGAQQVVEPANHQLSQARVAQLAYLKPASAGFTAFSNVDRTEGTPFLTDDWTRGKIRYEGQQNFSEDMDIMLNLENHALYIRLTSGFTGEFPLAYLDEVQVYLPADTLSYVPMNLQTLYKQGDYAYRFMRVLYRTEQFMLLHQPVKYLRKEAYVENLGMVRRPDKYMDTNRYWLYDGQQLQEVSRNERSISKALPIHASAIKSLVRTHKLNLSDEADIVRLLALLESAQ